MHAQTEMLLHKTLYKPLMTRLGMDLCILIKTSSPSWSYIKPNPSMMSDVHCLNYFTASPENTHVGFIYV